jgi:hypothetical protein
MRTLSTLFAATFAAAFVLGSFAISAATPPRRQHARAGAGASRTAAEPL